MRISHQFTTFSQVAKLIYLWSILPLALACTVNEATAEELTKTVGDSGQVVHILDEVVVYLKRPSKQPYVVSEITALEIEELGADTFADVLKYETGLVITDGKKNRSDLRIRAFTSQQPLLLLDGRPLNTGYMGSVDLSLLPVDLIEKVQVIKGPASVAYGANSLGGVINIITRTSAPEPLKVRFKSLFGDNAYRLLSAGVAGNWNDYHVCINAEELHRNGYTLSSDFIPTELENGDLRENSDHLRRGANLKIGHRLPNGGRYSLSLGHIWAEKGLPSSIYKPKYWRFTDWNRTTGTFTVGLPALETFTFRGNIFGNLYDDELITYRDRGYSSERIKSNSIMESRTFGGSAEAIGKPAESHELTFGIRGQQDHTRRQQNSGEPWEQYETETASLFVQDRYDITPGTSVTTGLGIYGFKKEDDRSWSAPVCPMASVAHELPSGYTFRLAGSRGVHFPSMHNLYSSTNGNPDLKPEEAWKIEASAEKTFTHNAQRFLHPELILFVNFTGNQIDKFPVTLDSSLYCNIRELETWGVEMNLSGSFSRCISGGLSLAAMKWEADELTIFNVPNLKLSAYLRFRTAYNTEIYTYWTYFGERDGDDESGGITAMPDYTVGNVNAEQPILSWLSVRVEVRNILDTYCEEEYGYPGPGRQFFAGLNMNQ